MENIIFNKLKEFEGKVFDKTLSAAGRWLAYTIINVSPGSIEVSVPVRPEMTNPSMQLHGGMMAMIMDEISGVAFYSLGSTTYYTTVNLVVDYLYSAAVGETVYAKAQVQRKGKKISNISCAVYNSNDICLARATTNLVNTEKAIFDLGSFGIQ
jgi:acyl-coenzyme A thioesterase 13